MGTFEVQLEHNLLDRTIVAAQERNEKIFMQFPFLQPVTTSITPTHILREQSLANLILYGNLGIHISVIAWIVILEEEPDKQIVYIQDAYQSIQQVWKGNINAFRKQLIEEDTLIHAHGISQQ